MCGVVEGCVFTANTKLSTETHNDKLSGLHMEQEKQTCHTL